MLSLTTPSHEPTKISYRRKNADTGTESSFVKTGLRSQSETVTSADADSGNMFMGVRKEANPKAKFMVINKSGQAVWFAHFCSSRFAKTSSRNIPTKLGIAPPMAPRHR